MKHQALFLRKIRVKEIKGSSAAILRPVGFSLFSIAVWYHLKISLSNVACQHLYLLIQL